jgi:hypothetical protein
MGKAAMCLVSNWRAVIEAFSKSAFRGRAIGPRRNRICRVPHGRFLFLFISNWVAVGTLVSQRPPHGSVREGLLHTALTLSL